MEKMPYREALDTQVIPVTGEQVVSTNWQHGLPVLSGGMVTLRDLRASDAASLFALLTTEEVARFISPPPTTVEGFEKFIAWTHRQREAGKYVCFAVTVKGFDTAIGIFQVRDLATGFDTAEWGFAIGSQFWGVDRSTGRAGSLDHSLHDPAYSFAPRRPACSSASRLWHAETPEPQ